MDFEYSRTTLVVQWEWQTTKSIVLKDLPLPGALNRTGAISDIYGTFLPEK